MHQPIPEQGRWLAQVVRGYFAYHAVPTNGLRISAFRTMWSSTHHRSRVVQTPRHALAGPSSLARRLTSCPRTCLSPRTRRRAAPRSS
jgi:hypothetical protein